MESFVRSLLDGHSTRPPALLEVTSEAMQRWGAAPSSLRGDARYARYLFERAVVRQLVRAMGRLGEIPLVTGPALLREVAYPASHLRACDVATLVHSPAAGGPLFDALAGEGFHVRSRDGWTEVWLEGLHPRVALCATLGMDGLFSPDLERLRSRASLDEQRFGALSWLPDAEDGMCLCVARAGCELLRGELPVLADVARWHRFAPSEPRALRRRLFQHGLSRLGPVVLEAAARVEGSAPLEQLVTALSPPRWASATAGLLVTGLRAARGRAPVVGALAYVLEPDRARRHRALVSRAQRVTQRLVS